jgi:hypothetical protein
VYARSVTKAAKRKKEKEEPDFAIPEFDEGAYMRKEVEGAKAAVVSVILAVPVAGVLYGLAVVGLAVVAFFLGIALTFSLPRIFRLLKVLPWPKVDTSTFERRDWLGHGSTFFFSWFAFWILLLNAPFVDLTNPVIGVTAFAGVTTIAMPPETLNTLRLAPSSTSVLFNVTIQENVGIDNATITVAGIPSALTHLGGPRYEFRYMNPITPFRVDVYALDVNGREARFGFEVQLA